MAAGYAADLVLVDPTTVADRATFDQPRLPPAGIPWVLIDGQPVVAQGERTGLRAGRALRYST